jgi:hypothetical protein
MTAQRTAALAALVLLSTALAGCGTLGRLNPFGGDDDSPRSTASAGTRIPVVAFDQTVTPAEALKGATFTLPPAQPLTDWPLPGGAPEQAIEHVQAAPNFAVAWRRDIGAGGDRRRHVTAPPVAAGGPCVHHGRRGARYGVRRRERRPGLAREPSAEHWRDREAFGGAWPMPTAPSTSPRASASWRRWTRRPAR